MQKKYLSKKLEFIRILNPKRVMLKTLCCCISGRGERTLRSSLDCQAWFVRGDFIAAIFPGDR